jgi:hypothetical protein
MGFKKPQYWGPFKYPPKRLNMVFRSCLITYWKKKDISISSSAQFVTPAKIYFTSKKFSYVLFSNPTNKTEMGTANRWGD